MIRTTLVALSALSVAACQQTPGPQANPFSSTSEGLRVALLSGCFPYLVEGGSIHDRLKGHSARGGKLRGKKATLMYGNGQTLIQQDERGGCYLASNGQMPNTRVTDAAKARQTVLDVVGGVGALTKRSDSGPGFNDEVGQYRQESYCFPLRGQQAWLVMSSSSDTKRQMLQVTVNFDHDGKVCSPQAAR